MGCARKNDPMWYTTNSRRWRHRSSGDCTTAGPTSPTRSTRSEQGTDHAGAAGTLRRACRVYPCRKRIAWLAETTRESRREASAGTVPSSRLGRPAGHPAVRRNDTEAELMINFAVDARHSETRASRCSFQPNLQAAARMAVAAPEGYGSVYGGALGSAVSAAEQASQG